MRLSRRSVFFFSVAVICAVLISVTPAEFRLVNYVEIGLASFWGVMIALEDLFGPGRGRRRPERPDGERLTRASGRSTR